MAANNKGPIIPCGATAVNRIESALEQQRTHPDALNDKMGQMFSAIGDIDREHPSAFGSASWPFRVADYNGILGDEVVVHGFQGTGYRYFNGSAPDFDVGATVVDSGGPAGQGKFRGDGQAVNSRKMQFVGL